jgi:hypothetical protein
VNPTEPPLPVLTGPTRRPADQQRFAALALRFALGSPGVWVIALLILMFFSDLRISGNPGARLVLVVLSSLAALGDAVGLVLGLRAWRTPAGLLAVLASLMFGGGFAYLVYLTLVAHI